MTVEFFGAPVRRVTDEPKYHFFGYYDKSPWDIRDHYILSLQTSFEDHPPRPEDEAVIGILDPEDNYAFKILTVTHAWNWQQGCMLQWIPGFENRIIFNDREKGKYVSVILDIESGDSYKLEMPVYALSHDGSKALTLNFSRLAWTRPGYGYAGIPDPYAGDKAPDDDGIYILDLRSGESELIISLGQMARFKPRSDMKGAVHWFNHLLFNQDDDRFIFLHRWSYEPGRTWRTRLFTADINGGNVCLLVDGRASHFDWRDSRHVLAWAYMNGIGERFFLFRDKSEDFEIVGDGVLTRNGHCSYSPDRKWILTDTYPDENNMQKLMLYNPCEDRLVEIGRFYSKPELRGEIRCDLHPRWSRRGDRICIDSTHEGTRQMYVIDVSEIVEVR